MNSPTLVRSTLFLLGVAFASGQTTSNSTFDSTGNAKSMGIKFTLAYPSTWTAREGKRPHVLQMFVAPNPGEMFTVTVDEATLTPSQLLTKEALTSLIPQGAAIVSHTTTKLDGEACSMCEWTLTSERAGISFEQRVLAFFVPFQGKVITLAGTVGGVAGKAELEDLYRKAKLRFQAIAATLYLPEKWAKPAR